MRMIPSRCAAAVLQSSVAYVCKLCSPHTAASHAAGWRIYRYAAAFGNLGWTTVHVKVSSTSYATIYTTLRNPLCLATTITASGSKKSAE